MTPAVLRFVPQRPAKADCAVASLATVCNVDYEDAAVVAYRVRPSVLTDGLFMREIRKAAKKLGVSLRLRRAGRYSLEDDWGILHVLKSEPPEDSHAVILTGRGDIYDGADNSLWEADAYFLHHGYKPGYLLVRED